MSNEAIEKEYKALISKDKYEWLYVNRNWNDFFVQKNYYYDTANLSLYKNNITFRIRKIDEKMRVQIKSPSEQIEEGYSIKKENEFDIDIDNIPDVFSNDKINNYFTNLKIYEPLILLGSLETFRCVEKIDDVLVCLDKNCYFDIIDYELEIEFTNSSNALTELLHGLQVKCANPIGKYSRFIDRLKEI